MPAHPVIELLLGRWDGRAVHTPVGELPYAIEFLPISEDCVEGVANPGAARHYWRFCLEAGDLTLRFLSDFHGNDRPILFQPAAADNDALVFQSITHDFLRVRLSPEPATLAIGVFHDDRLHVEIRLTRKMDTRQ